MSVELVEVTRSGVRECVHRGSAVVLGPDGAVRWSAGDIASPIMPRSSNKPMQAVAMLRGGFAPADDEELAMAAASHEGEPGHVTVVERILASGWLDERALCCPADLPGNEAARARALTGEGPRRVFMNCSGKHAAMLATCRVAQWPLESYLAADHPLQVLVRETIEELAAEGGHSLAVDGCGLPIVPLTLTGLARAYGRIVAAQPGSPERRVADALRAHPFLASGTGKDDLLLMSAVPGLLCKAGADGVHAGALPDGTAFALKIDDGHERARLPATAAILRALGVRISDELAERPVLGGGQPVGVVRAAAGVFSA